MQNGSQTEKEVLDEGDLSYQRVEGVSDLVTDRGVHDSEHLLLHLKVFVQNPVADVNDLHQGLGLFIAALVELVDTDLNVSVFVGRVGVELVDILAEQVATSEDIVH